MSNESTTTANADRRPTVVVLGGGYGGINAAKALDDHADVTLVDPKDAFVHNIAAWRALVEPEWLDRIFLPYEYLLDHGTFVRDRAIEVDGRRITLASGQELEPDYLILATGSSYPFPAKIDEVSSEKARERVREAHAALLGAQRVLVIGAGPAGLELSGEIKAFYPDKHVTLADISADVLQGPYDQALRDELRRQLDLLGVELRLGSALRELPAVPPATLASIQLSTESGEELNADIWYRAFGVTTHTEYLRGALAAARDDAGYVQVDEHLRVAGQERIFALGDISDADCDMAAAATAEAQVVAENVRALITGTELTAYEPLPPVIAVPLGPEGGAGQLPDVDGIAGPDVISDIKGRAMLLDHYGALFDLARAEAAAESLSAPTESGQDIVIAFDGSENARHAIRVAGRELGGGRAAVLHVWEPLVSGRRRVTTPALTVGAFDAEIELDAERALATAEEGAALARDAGFDAEAHSLRTGGSIGEAIVDYADQHPTRLVVIGTRGLSGLRSALAGSVTHHVTQHVHVPVLAVPPEGRE